MGGDPRESEVPLDLRRSIQASVVANHQILAVDTERDRPAG